MKHFGIVFKFNDITVAYIVQNMYSLESCLYCLVCVSAGLTLDVKIGKLSAHCYQWEKYPPTLLYLRTWNLVSYSSIYFSFYLFHSVFVYSFIFHNIEYISSCVEHLVRYFLCLRKLIGVCLPGQKFQTKWSLTYSFDLVVHLLWICPGHISRLTS